MSLPRTVVDLFSGAGGFSLGFHRAGFRIAAAVDHDELAGETFRRNFSELQPEHPPLVYSGEKGDISAFPFEEIEPPDVVIGGPPCQAYSKIGRGKLASLSDRSFAKDPRNELYRAFVNAIATWRPKALVMENVPGMLSMEGHNVADRVAEDLAGGGYDVRYTMLNAAWYGVPQHRERLFFLGYRNDLGIEPAFPKPERRPESTGGYHHREAAIPLSFDFIDDRRIYMDTRNAPLPAVSVFEALHDLPKITDHLDPGSAGRRRFREPRRYDAEPQSGYAKIMRTWPGLPESKELDDHAVRRTPRDYETFRRMQEGDRYPAAVTVAWDRAEAELEQLRRQGADTSEGSEAYRRVLRECVPPYGEAWDRCEDGAWNREFLDRWKKLVRNQPSWTVPAHLAKDSYSHIHYDSDQARMISVREAARLQSFPDGFRFAGSMGDCFRQIGNAVPPLLAFAVAQDLRLRLQGRAT
ncbi:MAG: DNA cytosine methyltransferase [bacterium]